MKTRDEILETWETEGQYETWYAVDSYDPATGRVHRLFVGDGERAKDMAAQRAGGYGLLAPDSMQPQPMGDKYLDHPERLEPPVMAEPGEYSQALFYRATVIPHESARDYMLASKLPDLPGGHMNELIPVAQAAKELGITRQSAYGLVERGAIASEEIGEIRVGRYSVALRLAAK